MIGIHELFRTDLSDVIRAANMLSHDCRLRYLKTIQLRVREFREVPVFGDNESYPLTTGLCPARSPRPSRMVGGIGQLCRTTYHPTWPGGMSARMSFSLVIRMNEAKGFRS